MGTTTYTNGETNMRELVLSAWGTLRAQLLAAECAQWWAAYDVVGERRDRVWAWWLARTGEDLYAG